MTFFKNKKIWITGASSGIGEALAHALAAEGALLVLSARNERALNSVAAECMSRGAAAAHVQPLDLSDTSAIGPIVQRIQRELGHIDILINNGGVSQRSRALDTAMEVDERLMRVNYLGTIALTKAVLPGMLKHQLGHIVTITSLTGKFGSPLRSSYAASKHALHGFFDSLRAELADTPILVTLVCPGFVRTNISINALTGDGAPQGAMDEATSKGMRPEVLARKILNAIRKRREELWVGGREVVGVYIKRFFPRLFSRLIARAKVT
ncbi:MAG: SDR family oxidoreductase [Saprospiraceae bacterium]